MGGIGSGNRNQWPVRDTVESCHRVDIRYMKKQKLLTPGTQGTLHWSRNGEPTGDIRYQVFSDYLKLIFRYRQHGGEWQPMEQTVYFDHTPCHYGGHRQWLLCPHCNRRVAVLCSNGPRFLCRHCYGLAYTSQQQSPSDRAITQKHKLGDRLFEHYEYGEGCGKPKGMHWSTFERLKAKYNRYERRWWAHVAPYLPILSPEERQLLEDAKSEDI